MTRVKMCSVVECPMIIRSFLVSAGILTAGRIVSGSDSVSGGLVMRTHRRRQWICYSVNPERQKLGLFHSGDDGAPLKTFPVLERHLAKLGRGIVVGMNAGMLEVDGSPVAWCVVDGKTIQRPKTKTGSGNFFLKPNGVFTIQGGKALVMETGAAMGILNQADLVTQSGPLLLTGAQVHPAIRKNSSNRLVRNAVGVTVDGMVWLAISEEPVSFHEYATLFRDDLGCPDALFPDGVVSRLHAPGWGRDGGATAL